MNNLQWKKKINRYSQLGFHHQVQRGFGQGGRANEAASILLRGSESTSRGNTQSLSVSERYERDKRQQPVQKRIIENKAKTIGVWHDKLDAYSDSLKNCIFACSYTSFFENIRAVHKL